MAGLPKGFGMKFDSTKVGPSTAKPARPRHKKDQSKPTPTEDKISKKRESVKANVESKGAPPKRVKTTPDSSSLLISELNSPTISFIKDEDVKKWKALSPEAENQALIQASAQFLIASIGRAQKLKEEGARLKKDETDVYKLTHQIKDMELNHQKECSQQEDRINIFKKEAEDCTEINHQLCKTMDAQEKEIAELKARLEDQPHGWVAEKTKIQVDSFASGLKHYATGFLANDPEYNFTKFGEETVQWIKNFKVDEAATIKARRIELGLEEVEAVEDAPEDDQVEDDENASILQSPLGDVANITPLQVVHPSDYASREGGAPKDGVPPTA